MPAISLTTGQTLILVGLLILWAACLFGGFAFGSFNAEGTHRIARPLRMTSSLTLVVFAWMWVLFTQADAQRLGVFFAVGMTLGFIGDLFMARLIIKNDAHVLGGMGAFGLGHVAYIIGLLDYGGAQWGAMLVWWLLAAGIWYGVIWRTTADPTPQHIAALPYALLLAATAGAATGIALEVSGFAIIAVGAALFLGSDLLLALQLFSGWHFKGIGDAVWLTYGPGQMLIVAGVFFMTL